MSSLRDIYKNKQLIIEKSKETQKSFFKRLFWPFGVFKVLKIMNETHIFNFICPHCLKSILLENLSFICPFCDEKYGEIAETIAEKSENYWLYNIAHKAEIIEKEKVLFDKCNKCAGKIRYIKCYHCDKPIDLFAPYNEEELERKRYE